ncbi:BON domain-containing protein [Iodobacter fluviatilis]|uniref:BON domain-containing protein n=1 Tax=Iodobacter fluviatilis TaxID=537 RepID=A0A377SWL4_9NEIS|nr:BON domain-containing protein [Iodobacter fluviatilis]TCU88209.1 BON domain-containing protein [Iodobacter fluviatilis]STR45710.1 Osmotically-inducible protein Y precursor [Iodobacter fluviatilis]
MKIFIVIFSVILSLSGCNAPTNTEAHITDLDVTTKVKTSLLNDNELKAFNITVVTTKGDVRLTGVVDTQIQVDRAAEITRKINGVHALHDELTIKK